MTERKAKAKQHFGHWLLITEHSITRPLEHPTTRPPDHSTTCIKRKAARPERPRRARTAVVTDSIPGGIGRWCSRLQIEPVIKGEEKDGSGLKRGLRVLENDVSGDGPGSDDAAGDCADWAGD
jgi:hypothetical protein